MNAWWVAAAAAVVVAVLAGVADWRRRERRDLDKIGWIDWRNLQMYALLVAAMCAAVAWHG